MSKLQGIRVKITSAKSIRRTLLLAFALFFTSPLLHAQQYIYYPPSSSAPIVTDSSTSVFLEMVSGGSATQSGTISGNGAIYVDTGTGTLTITAPNTSTNSLTVDNGTLIVSGTGAAMGTPSANSYLYVGFDSGDNGSMIFSDGVLAYTTETSVGDGTSTTGSLTVTGSGTSLHTGDANIGNYGSGSLLVSNGGQFAGNVYIGYEGGSTGAVTVTGSGSSLNSGSSLKIGYLGSGALTVSNGGLVTTGVVSMSLIGNASTVNLSSGGVLQLGQIVNFSGTNAFLNFDGGIIRATGPSGDFISGFSGTEVQLLSGGGTIDNNGFDITINASLTGTSSSGDANFTGTGTTTLTATNTYQGATLIKKGTLAVSGAGAAITQTSSVYVGNGGTLGALLISGGGYVHDTNGNIGVGGTSTGIATVDGTGSAWTNTGTLVVGQTGTGVLTVSNSGTVTDVDGYIGQNTNMTGSVTVTSGGTWTSTESLFVGYQGSGTLTISNGGQVSSQWGYIGEKSSGTGTVTVTGTGSLWNVTTSLIVGDSGTGTLTILNGGAVKGASIKIGYGNKGTVVVTSSGSLISSANMTVGADSSGTLTISNGGKVSDVGAHIGDDYGGNGIVSVDGSGSTWTNSGDLYVGYGFGGTGTLTITNGGTVKDVNGIIGGSGGAIGSVTVDGTGSTWTNSGNLTVGSQAQGALIVSNSGTVSAVKVTLGSSATGSGTVDLASGGVLATGQVVAGSGTTTLLFDGGILRATANSADFISGFTGTEVQLLSGGGTIDNNGSDITINAPFTGSGGLTFTGTATTTLTGTSTYSGDTTIDLGMVMLSGTAAALTQTNNLLVGINDGDNATLTITGGAKVSANNTLIGYVPTAAGSISVTGTGSTLNIGDTMEVGDFGVGTLTISDSGSVSVASATIAHGQNGTGIATITSGGSWTLTSDLLVGSGGSGTLVISNGGKVTETANGTHTYVGYNDSGTGTVTVTGTGSSWDVTGDLILGNYGKSTLTITNGGMVSDYNGVVARYAGSTSSITVSGPGSTWTSTYMGVGYSGSGTMTISDGGTVTGTYGYIGYNYGGTGTITVTGTGSLWHTDDYLRVGSSGTGTLLVTNGGSVTGTYGYIGYAADSLGNVTVTGTGSSWVSDQYISVGESGTGTLTILDGGYVSTNDLDVAYDTNSQGNLTVDGSTSLLSLTGTLTVGYGGTGTMTISNGGTVTGTTGILANTGTSTAYVTVTGTGSSWTNSGNLTVGGTGTGVLTISNRGTVSNMDGYIGHTNGSTGSVTVDGTGSAWTNSNNLYVGWSGTGTLTISNGGHVLDQSAIIGVLGNGAGSVTVDGTGSTWTNSNDLYVGSTGTATLTISNGGMVTSATTQLGSVSPSHGTLNLNSDGVLATGQVLAGPGTVALNFDGGILRATGTNTDFISGFTGTQVELLSGGGTIDNNGYDITIQSPLTGIGSATFTGSGSTTLTGTNTYTGETMIASGTLALKAGGSIASSSEVYLASGATLDIRLVDGVFSPVDIQNLSGTAGSFVNVSGQSLVINQSETTTYAGTIQNGPTTGWGGGTVQLTGTGTLKLTGTNTYSGGTTIDSGALEVGNAQALGNGSVTLNGGTLSTDGVNHQIDIDGNYTQTGGTLLLNLYSATVYDTVALTNPSGVATVSGTLKLNINGSFAPGQGQEFDLITTSNAVSGTFGTVLTNLPSIGGTINYSNNVALIFQKAFVGLDIPLTPNQTSVATYIDTHDQAITNPDFANLVGALNLASGNSSTLQSAFNQLSPLNFANFASSTSFNNASFFTQQFDGYLANHRGPNGGFASSEGGLDYSGLAINDPQIDPSLQSTRSRLLAWSPAPNIGLLSDSSSAVLGGTDMKDMIAPTALTNPWNVFVTGNVVLAQDFSNNQAGLPYNSSTTGAVEVGADYRITHTWLLGAAFGYGHTHADLDTIGSNATVNTYSPAVYTSYADKGWFVNGLASYGFSNYSQQRNVSIPGFGGTASSSPGGSQILGNIDGGYEFHRGPWTFGPTLGLQYVHLTVDGYSETGLPGADLTVNQNDADSLRSRLGGTVNYTIKTASLIFTPHFSASWQHEFMDQSRGVTAQFNSVGAGSFVVNTPNPSRDSALIDVGLDMQVNNSITVFTDYSAQAGQSNYFGQSVQAGVKIGF